MDSKRSVVGPTRTESDTVAQVEQPLESSTVVEEAHVGEEGRDALLEGSSRDLEVEKKDSDTVVIAQYEPNDSQSTSTKQQDNATVLDSTDTIASSIAPTSPDLTTELEKLRQAHQEELKERHQELHSHLERIDALQSKLQYLAKSAAESARKASSDADPGSFDSKLAEREERIALLMDEGQKLSKNELKNLNTIKKLPGQERRGGEEGDGDEAEAGQGGEGGDGCDGASATGRGC